MKFTAMISALMMTGLSAHAQDNEAACVVKINGEIRYDFIIPSVEGSNMLVGEFNGFRVYFHHNADQKFSLELCDLDNEVRTYSDVTLRNVGEDVTSTVWKRDILVEATCKLHK